MCEPVQCIVVNQFNYMVFYITFYSVWLDMGLTNSTFIYAMQPRISQLFKSQIIYLVLEHI